jgi:hypothetical protein
MVRIIEKSSIIFLVLLLLFRFKNAFIFTRLQTEQEMDRRGIPIPKEYTWPESFPDCTPALRMYHKKQKPKNNFSHPQIDV